MRRQVEEGNSMTEESARDAHTGTAADGEPGTGHEQSPAPEGRTGVDRAKGPAGASPRGGRSPLMTAVRVFAILAWIVFAGVLGYVPAATMWNNWEAARSAAEYAQQAADAAASAPQEADAEMEAAREYNESLTGVPIVDPYEWSSRGAGSTATSYADYESRLTGGGTGVMGRVRVPSVGIDLPVRHGTSVDVLATGAGHVYGTALPVGGPGTRPVITSHTGYPTATLFDHLVDVKPGDLMFVDVAGETLAYEVDGSSVVLPSEVDALRPREGEELLTLLTCTPYGVNSHRLLVTGHRVPYESQRMSVAPSPVAQAVALDWRLRLMGAASVLVTAALVVSGARAVVRRVRGRRGAGRPSSTS